MPTKERKKRTRDRKSRTKLSRKPSLTKEIYSLWLESLNVARME
jgi:hypothetical protein